MKIKSLLNPFAILVAFALCVSTSSGQGTAFTYQGRLNDGGATANGNYDLSFAVYDASLDGNIVGGPITNSAVAVTGGMFTTTLDFGVGVFPGPNRWLQIGVRTNGNTGQFVALLPRQQLTATPYAITAGDASSPNLARLNVADTSRPATGTVTVSFGFVVNATVTSGGFGYTSPPTVAVNDSTGSGAVVSATVSNGAVVSLQVVQTGSGYSQNATLSIGVPPPNNYQTFITSNNFSGVSVFSNPNNIFVGNASGLLNVPNTVTWQAVAVTSLQAQPNSGYVLTGSSPVTITLPVSASVGNRVRIAGSASSTWQLAQNSGQSIVVAGAYPAASYGSNWVQRAALPSGGAICGSSDGTKFYALQQSNVWASTDSGSTWSFRTSLPVTWNTVACSADGSRLVATTTANTVYTSVDSGFTWISRGNPTLSSPSTHFSAASSSADGTKLALAHGSAGADKIYVSIDSGATWTPRAFDAFWSCIPMSADGSRMVTMSLSGNTFIYTSLDGGTNFTARTLVTNWFTAACTPDGTKIAGTCGNGILISSDFGTNWVGNGPNGVLCTTIAMSADGQRLVAAVNGGLIYTSNNGGASWTSRESNRNWTVVVSSADGLTLAAMTSIGQVFISRVQPPLSVSTTVGSAGYLLGNSGSAIELLNIGNGQWQAISSAGSFSAY